MVYKTSFLSDIVNYVYVPRVADDIADRVCWHFNKYPTQFLDQYEQRLELLDPPLSDTIQILTRAQRRTDPNMQNVQRAASRLDKAELLRVHRAPYSAGMLLLYGMVYVQWQTDIEMNGGGLLPSIRDFPEAFGEALFDEQGAHHGYRHAMQKNPVLVYKLKLASDYTAAEGIVMGGCMLYHLLNQYRKGETRKTISSVS